MKVMLNPQHTEAGRLGNLRLQGASTDLRIRHNAAPSLPATHWRIRDALQIDRGDSISISLDHVLEL